MTNLGRGKARTALAVSAVAVLGVVAACGSNDGGPGTSGDTAAKVEINRQAAGDITTHGGAQRLAGDQTQAIADSIQRSTAKNVILVIGDGTANQELTLARDYEWGAGGKIPGIDELPLSGDYTTYALDKTTKKPDYTTDSAASGSAWATGTKTYNGAVGVDGQEPHLDARQRPAEARARAARRQRRRDDAAQNGAGEPPPDQAAQQQREENAVHHADQAFLADDAPGDGGSRLG